MHRTSSWLALLLRMFSPVPEAHCWRFSTIPLDSNVRVGHYRALLHHSQVREMSLNSFRIHYLLELIPGFINDALPTERIFLISSVSSWECGGPINSHEPKPTSHLHFEISSGNICVSIHPQVKPNECVTVPEALCSVSFLRHLIVFPQRFILHAFITLKVPELVV